MSKKQDQTTGNTPDNLDCEQVKKALDSPECREFVKKECETALKSHTAGAQAGALDWTLILGLVFDAVKKWLDSRI